MDNKGDLEELEKWNAQRIVNEKEKSKFYFEEFEKKKNIDRFTKGLEIIGTIIRIIIHIIILIAIFIGLQFLYARIARFL